MGRPATLRVDIVTDAKGASRGIEQTEGRLGKWGRRLGTVGKAAAAGLAVAGAAAVAAGVSVAKSASRQEQAFGALDSIYGKSAKRVKAWARGAADSVGLARGEYAELASVVGAQLQGMGFESDKSATKTRGLIKTGADLAATFGGSVSEAVGAVSSLLKGERDPIERYGVSIKQADVNARLAKLGLDGLTGSAAKQAEAQAVLSLLNEQTAKSTGAFARESNTLAGQQERLKAKFENVKATVGAKLTPVLTRLFSWINNKLFPGAAKLGRELSSRFGPTLKRVGGFITGTVVPAARDLYSWFMNRIYPSMKRSVRPILDGIKDAFRRVSDAISDNRGNLSKLGTFLRKLIEAANPVREMFGKLLGFAFRTAGFAISAAIRTVSTFVGWLESAADAVGWVIDKLTALKNLSPGKILSGIGALFTAAPVHRMTSPVTSGPGSVGLSPGLALSSLNLAASSSSPLGLGSVHDPTLASAYVDARSFPVTVNVDGALDAPAVARQLERLLAQHARRMGRARAFGAAS